MGNGLASEIAFSFDIHGDFKIFVDMFGEVDISGQDRSLGASFEEFGSSFDIIDNMKKSMMGRERFDSAGFDIRDKVLHSKMSLSLSISPENGDVLGCLITSLGDD